jgi:exonuclease III
MDKQLTVLQWNAAGSRGRRELKKFLSQHKIDIACIQETYLKETQLYSIPDYTIYRKDRQTDQARGGVALIVYRTIEVHLKSNFPKIEAQCLSVKLCNRNSNVFNVYSASDTELDKAEVESMFRTPDAHPR